jgi:hypothetical protein
MRNRLFFAAVGVTAATIIVAVVSVLVSGQSARVPEAAADLRTPWGEPDLQGVWTRDTDTPFERPEAYAGREFLTDEEVAALDRKKAQDPGRNVPTQEGDVGTYNAVFNSVLRTGKRTSLVIDPPDGKIPPLTPAGQKKEAAALAEAARLQSRLPEGPEDLAGMTRCLGSSLPNIGGGVFGNVAIRVVQSLGVMAIYQEFGHQGGSNRVLRVDGRPHLAPRLQFWLGDSRARWDGNTLVVDTTNFSPRFTADSTFRTNYHGPRENLHLIERWTRIDANTLRRRITFDDPTTWTKPWTVELDFGKTDEKANLIFESACHEGNYSMPGILGGSRIEERAAAAKK